MRGVAHVWPQAPRPAGAWTEVSAVVEWPFRWDMLRRPRRQRIWVRLPESVPVDERAAGDAFLLATAFGALRRADALRVHAEVAPDLLDHVARLGRLYVERHPRAYHAVEYAADATARVASRDAPAALCFSGGLDSTHSLGRHARGGGAPGPATLGGAVMIHGADIPVGETEGFARAFARAGRITESRGVPLVAVATNLRDVKQKWTHSFTAALAAVMNLLRGRFGRGLVAVGFTAAEAPVWWPQDATDPGLVSSGAFPVEGDGYEADRQAKMDGLADWPEARENLRVCWRPGSWAANCGTCFKCVVARMMARVAFGEVPACLPDASPDEDVRTAVACEDPVVRLRFQQILGRARAKGMRAPWLDEVERVLARTARPPA